MHIYLGLIFCLCLFAIIPGAHAVQTCNPNNIPASTPDSRLTDNGNNTITDTKTGLMWKKCEEGVSGNGCETGTAATFSWQTALRQPGVVNNGGGFAGYGDWRLPNIKELGSIVERKCSVPAINMTRFPNTPSNSVVWSGSPYAYNSDYAWYVNFASGNSFYVNRNYNYRVSYGQVRLVRGGQ
jgi:hypothetical protein